METVLQNERDQIRGQSRLLKRWFVLKISFAVESFDGYAEAPDFDGSVAQNLPHPYRSRYLLYRNNSSSLLLNW